MTLLRRASDGYVHCYILLLSLLYHCCSHDDDVSDIIIIYIIIYDNNPIWILMLSMPDCYYLMHIVIEYRFHSYRFFFYRFDRLFNRCIISKYNCYSAFSIIERLLPGETRSQGISCGVLPNIP